MNVVAAALSLTLAGGILLGAAVTAADPEPAASAPATTAAPPERILFIGNSHTRRNVGMDWLVGQMVRAHDPDQPYSAATRTENGVDLEYHYRNGAPQQIRSGEWDAVVLQGYLAASEARTAESFKEYARLLDGVVREAGARTVLYMTWPQGRYGWADIDDIVAAHREVAAELGVPVAPAGIAFELAAAERPDLELVSEDEVHATWDGAYLAALTIYATLFERDPRGVEFAFGVAPEDAAFLQRIAAEAIATWESGTP